MEGTHERKGYMTVAVTLCIVMLALVFLTLAHMLWPQQTGLTGGAGTWVAQTTADGTHGMVLIDIMDDDTASFYHVSDMGVYVLAVDENSEAYMQGVRSGDRIVSVNNVPIFISSDLSELEAAMPQGGMLVFTLSRGHEEDVVTVTLNTDTEA